MTRDEFIEDVTTWSELLSFCSDEGYETDDIYTSEDRDDYIDEDLVEMARNDSWRDVLSTLRDLEDDDGFEYYRRDDWNGWVGLSDGDDEFDSYKENVLEWMDDNGYWPGDEEDDDEEDEYDDEEEAPPVDDEDDEFSDEDDDDFDVEEEDCSFGEMFAASAHCIRTIAQEEIDEAKEQDKAFLSFVRTA